MAAFRGGEFSVLGHGEIPCGNQARHSPLDGENGELVYFTGSKLWKLAAGWLYASLPCRPERSKLRLRLRVASAAGPNGIKGTFIATARWPLRANIASHLLRSARGLTASRYGVAIRFKVCADTIRSRRRLVGPSGQHRTSAAPLGSRA